MGLRTQTESDVVRQCLDYLNLQGILAWRNNSTGIYDPTRKRFRAFQGLRGTSDILGCLPKSGRLLAVECKKPGGRLSEHQRHFLQLVGAANGLALCVSSLDDLIAALRVEGLL